MGLIIVPILIYDDMKRLDTKKDLKDITPLISDKIESETDQEIFDKIQKRKNESEALKKLLINLSEPSVKKSKHHQ